MNIIFSRYSHRHLLNGGESISTHRSKMATVYFGWHEKKKNMVRNNKNRAGTYHFHLTELVFLRESIRNPSEVSMEFVPPGSNPDLGKSFKPSLMAFSTSVLDTLNSFMAS